MENVSTAYRNNITFCPKKKAHQPVGLKSLGGWRLLTVQFGLKQLVHHTRIGLALGCLHHLTDKEAQ